MTEEDTIMDQGNRARTGRQEGVGRCREKLESVALEEEW